MKKLFGALLLLGTLSGAHNKVAAQMIQDPTSWTYEVRKKSATNYQLIFHLKLQAGFHIWALKPGGDGYQIVPSFVFDKNDNVKLVGDVKENGKITTGKMEGVEGIVSYYSGNVDYIQEVTAKGPVKITGKNGYQVCNDMMCLPPKDKKFVFEIK